MQNFQPVYVYYDCCCSGGDDYGRSVQTFDERRRDILFKRTERWSIGTPYVRDVVKGVMRIYGVEFIGLSGLVGCPPSTLERVLNYRFKPATL